MLNKTLKTALWLTNTFIVLLAVCAVGLPWAVTWYVETMGRAQKLPAIIMVVCYPCVPFAGGILFYIKRIIKNLATDNIFHLNSIIYFNRIALFCLIISVITLIGGRFYLPFLIVGVAFAFFAFLAFVFKTAYYYVAKEIDKDLEKDEKPRKKSKT